MGGAKAKADESRSKEEAASVIVGTWHHSRKDPFPLILINSVPVSPDWQRCMARAPPVTWYLHHSRFPIGLKSAFNCIVCNMAVIGLFLWMGGRGRSQILAPWNRIGGLVNVIGPAWKDAWNEDSWPGILSLSLLAIDDGLNKRNTSSCWKFIPSTQLSYRMMDRIQWFKLPTVKNSRNSITILNAVASKGWGAERRG